MRVLLHYDNPEPLAEVLRARFPEAEVQTCDSYDGLDGALQAFQPDALYCIKFENKPYPRDAVMSCAALRWVGIGGVGVDHVMPWDPERLTVTNSSGVSSQVMASYVIGGILALTLGFPRFMRQQRERLWPLDSVGQVAGKTLCIVGLGQTGQAVAKLAVAHGINVIGIRSRPRETPHVSQVYAADRLIEALGRSDLLVVATPLLDSTRNMIGDQAIAALNPGAIVVDVSRGGVVDSQALIAGLQSGHLGGAVLDVFAPEPMPADCPLWDMENVIVTPHCSAVFDGWELKSVEMFCDNLARWQAGEPLVNVVDPKRGY
ncbi:MAG: D-2-hydroxyacid dehydrogenase [Pseudomonadota bacterium]